MTPEQWAHATPEERAVQVARFGPPPLEHAVATLPRLAPPPRTSRRGWWIADGIVVVLVIVGLVTAGRTATTSPRAASVVAATTVETPTGAAVPAMSVEDAFVADILDTPGLSSDMDRGDMISLGRKLCLTIPDVADHAALVDVIGQTKIGPQVAEVFISSAEKHLCPYATYGTELLATATATATAAAPAPPVAAGPLSTVPPGTYEVGTGAGEVAPGKYRAAAPDGSSGSDCYYARLRHNDGSVDDIIGNNISQGQSLLTVKASDGYLVVDGCTFDHA